MQALRAQLIAAEQRDPKSTENREFELILNSRALDGYIATMSRILGEPYIEFGEVPNSSEARAFGFVEPQPNNLARIKLTEKGRAFFSWVILRQERSAP